MAELPYPYKHEDKFVEWHKGDQDLDVIRIDLPSLTKWYEQYTGVKRSWEECIKLIDGYGLPPSQQKFKRTVMPEKIKMLYAVVFQKKAAQTSTYKTEADVTHEDLYEELAMNQKYYAEEITWIKREIRRRYIGYWCFINGKPTYLNGANYFFLNYWKIKNQGKNDNYPDYRDYQRRMFHVLYYAYTTTDAFFRHRIAYRKDGETHITHRNSDPQTVREEFDEMNVPYFPEWDVNVTVKTDKRTIHGINFVSGRRIAKTAISCCFCTWGTLNMPDQTFVIQAMNEDHARDKVFVKQIQMPVSKLPFFFLPYYKGRIEAVSSGLRFQYEGHLVNASRAGLIPEQMECFITPMASTEKAADGEAEIAFVYRDEPGKKTDEKAADQNIIAWWFNTMKPAIERGEHIRGFTILPTTVGNMKTGGGSQFLELADNSHFSDRNDNGRTDSGLINVFLDGAYAVEGFIDEFGMSIVDDPEEPVLTNEGKYITIGARTYLKNQIDSLTRKRDWKNLTKLQQNFPQSWRDAFALVPEDMGLPIDRMRDRISELKFDRKYANIQRKISLTWKAGFGSEVEVVDDPSGPWVMTYLPPVEIRNRKTVVDSDDGYIPPANGPIYAPDPSVAGRFFLCADPVKFHKRNTAGKKKSNASAAMFYIRDRQVDPDNKPREEWVSQDWTMIYNEKVEDKESYHEEWLKACILCNSYLYPEWPDAEAVVEYFRSKGYDGYLLRDMGIDGKIDQRPGVWASDATKNEMLGDIMTFFSNNVRYVKIWQIIEEWTQMRGVDDLTNHDLCASTGWCMRAIRSRLPELWRELHAPVEISGRGFMTFDA